MHPGSATILVAFQSGRDARAPRKGLIRVKTALVVEGANLDDLSAKRQKRSYRLLGRFWQEALGHRPFTLFMAVLGKSFDMAPLSMGRVIVSMDGAIHILPVPVMSEPTFLNFRPPEVDVAFIDQEHPEFGIDTVDIQDDVRKFSSCYAFQLSKVNHYTRSSSSWIRLVFAVRWSTR